MGTFKTKGIIIKEYSIGESDKFLGIFTKTNGKIMVTAPYAKKYNKGLASGTQLFVYGDFMLQEYKGNYKLLQMEVIEAFHSLREDLMRLSYSAYVLELLDGATAEEMPMPDILRLVVRTLQAMGKDNLDPKLIRHIFELKYMSFIGYMPNLFGCIECGEVPSENRDFYFDISQGGVLCQSCITGSSRYCYKISPNTLYTMQYIISVHIDEVYKFTVSNEILSELSKVISNYVLYYVDKNFKTLDFIKQIESIQ